MKEEMAALDVCSVKEDDIVGDGAIDLNGRPSVKSKTGNWVPCCIIFGAEVAERIAYYAISSNLVTYLTDELHEGIAEAATNVNNWSGTVYISPLLGAFIADAFLGRYWTLAVSSCAYFLAMVFVTMAVSVPSLKPPACIMTKKGQICPKASSTQVGFFYFALYLMAISAGGIKATVSAYSGDQFDATDPKEGKRKLSFLNWWFVAISSGTMFSVSVLVYVEDNVGWFWGYGAATASVGIATAAYFLATNSYRNQKPAGSPLTRIAQVIVAAARKYKAKVPSQEDQLYEVTDKEADPHSRRLPHTKEFQCLDKAAVDDLTVCKTQGSPIDPWKLCPVTQVEEVKLLIRIMPIWVTNLLFYTVFAQIGTLFLSQGVTMDRHMGPHFQVPAASFPIFIQITVVVLLPIYDKYFVRFMKKFTGDERGISMLQRIGVGQLLSTASIAVAAVIEMKRLKVAKEHNLLDNTKVAVPMTIYWLLPQYLLMGLCEVLISVGQVEFFIDQSPDSMKSVGAALYLSTISVGSFISSVLVSAVEKVTHNSNGGWIGNNMNRSRIDLFYWLLTILSILNLFAFVLCAKWYRYKSAGTDDSTKGGEQRTSGS